MKALLILVLSTLLPTTSFAAPNYVQMCMDDHTENISLNIDNSMTSTIEPLAKEKLIKAFNEAKMKIDNSNIYFKEIVRNKESIDYFFIVEIGDTIYEYSAVLLSGNGDIEQVFNFNAKDNKVVNSIGEIVTPATEVTCSGTKFFNGTLNIINVETEVVIDTIILNKENPFNYEGTGLFTVGL